jgi:hypothetical protein
VTPKITQDHVRFVAFAPAENPFRERIRSEAESTLAALASGERVVVSRAELEACVPSSWLDPLLTGPNKVIGSHPFDCPDIERLLKAIRARIAALSPSDGSAR